MSKEATGLGLGLEDPHLVAQTCELPGRGQTGWPGADDRHALAVGRRDLYARAVHLGVVAVGDEPLEPADRDRGLEVATSAFALARCVAGSSEGADQRRRVQDQLERLLVLSAADKGHVAVRLDAGWTRVDAR